MELCTNNWTHKGLVKYSHLFRASGFISSHALVTNKMLKDRLQWTKYKLEGLCVCVYQITRQTYQSYFHATNRSHSTWAKILLQSNRHSAHQDIYKGFCLTVSSDFAEMKRILNSVILSVMCFLAYGVAAKLTKFRPRLGTSSSRCEPVDITMCKGQPYNHTHFPNLLGHETQEEAEADIALFKGLVKLNCSLDLVPFLCSLYAPVCISMNGSIQSLSPCRHNCRRVRRGCAKVMQRYGYRWPKTFRCKRFPKKKSNSLCIDWMSKEKKKQKKKNDQRISQRKGMGRCSKNKKSHRRNKKKGKKVKKSNWNMLRILLTERNEPALAKKSRLHVWAFAREMFVKGVLVQNFASVQPDARVILVLSSSACLTIDMIL